MADAPVNPTQPTEASPRAFAFIALGSNLGDSTRLLTSATRRMTEWSARPLRVSSFWRSSPVNCPPASPDFINAVVQFTPPARMTPDDLLARLQALEREFGRIPQATPNAPRPLDLDLIAFGSEVRHSPPLTLPHPRAHLRRFVLQPLAEIAPDLILPGQSQTVASLLADLQTDETLTRL